VPLAPVPIPAGLAELLARATDTPHVPPSSRHHRLSVYTTSPRPNRTRWSGFESDVVAVLDGAGEAWPVPRLSREAAGLGQPTTPEVAVYDDTVGRVEVHRHHSGEPIAGEAGRRYIGYLDTPSSGWGGARPGAGRKPLQGDGGPQVRRTVTLPAATVEALTALGEGNLSAGIRALWASHQRSGSDA
jgi:hypothetical protein